MTTADELIALVRTYNPKTNQKKLREAFVFGEAMHEGQYRHSGEPYFTHPVAVAGILAEQREMVENAYRSQCGVIDFIERDGWICLRTHRSN